MIAPLLEAGKTTSIDVLVARHAGVRVESLGNGLAELRLVDRAENVAVIRDAVRAIARTAAHLGQPGTVGRLRAEAVSNWARETLRSGKAPTPFGPPMPIEHDHGAPVRLLVRERGAGRLVPAATAATVWELPGLGPLSSEQVDALHDDPMWEGLVTFRPMLAGDDVDYLSVCGQEVSTHDPPPVMLRMLLARDGGECRHPACDDPGEADDIHHATAFAQSGRTRLDELMLLHAACHRDIHQGWHVESLGDGDFAFTDPHGATHHTTPPGLHRPDHHRGDDERLRSR